VERTCETRVLLQLRHSKAIVLRFAIATMPHLSQSVEAVGIRIEEEALLQQLGRAVRDDAIWEGREGGAMQHRSSSSDAHRAPSLRSGGRLRGHAPSMGWRVSMVTGPRARLWILSSTCMGETLLMHAPGQRQPLSPPPHPPTAPCASGVDNRSA